MTNPDFKNSGRGVAAPGHPADKENPLPTHPSLQPVGTTPDMDAVTRCRIEEMGTSPVEIAAEHIEESRLPLREAMKLLDCTEHRDLHLRVANLIRDIDDFRVLLSERHAS